MDEKSEDELLGIASPKIASDKASKDEAIKMDISTTEDNMEDIEEELLGIESVPSSDTAEIPKDIEKGTANKTSETIEDIEEELLLLSSSSDIAEKNKVSKSQNPAVESVVESKDEDKSDSSESVKGECLISDDSINVQEVKSSADSNTVAEVSSNTSENDQLKTKELAVVTPTAESPKPEIEILDIDCSTSEKKKTEASSRTEKCKRQTSCNSDVEVIDVAENVADTSKPKRARSGEAIEVLNSPTVLSKSKPGVSSADTVIEVMDEDELEIVDNSESDIYETGEISEESNSFMDGKICIYSSHGSFLVWNAEDAQMLREECRIVGKLTGCLPRAPYQNVHLGLPLQLMPEEARLLTDIDAAVVVEETETSDRTWRTRERAFKSMREENYKIQEKLYKEERKEQMRKRVGEIVAGKKEKKRKKAKKRKIQEAVVKESEAKSKSMESPLKLNQKAESKQMIEGSPSPSKSEEVIVGEESSDEDDIYKSAHDIPVDDIPVNDIPVNDIPVDDIPVDDIPVDDIPVAEAHIQHALVVQIFTENPWRRSLEPANDFRFPGSGRDILRYAVFKDLWKKGYCLTSGVKFGGDFLVYPGDPSRFHSHFIAVCMQQHQEIPMLDVISKGRLGSNVRKSTLLCSLSRKKKVIYTSLQWTGIA